MKKNWQWNEDRWGYDGVHLDTGELLWYTHKHNPHGGGGARGQSLEHFIEHGPACSIPGELLVEVRAAVEQLVKEQ